MLSVLSGCCNLPHDINRTKESSIDNRQQSIFQNAIDQQNAPENITESKPDKIAESAPENTVGSTPKSEQKNSIVRQVDGSLISSREAKEIAVDFVGYGVVHDITAFRDEGVLVFEVDIRYDTLRYVVQLIAENGSVESLNRHESKIVTTDELTDGFDITEKLQDTSNTTDKMPNVDTSNTAISLERAIEIAYTDLKARGIDAAYRSNSGIDREKGQWVWELLFRTTGERMPFIEYYINAENGNIVKFEWDD